MPDWFVAMIVGAFFVALVVFRNYKGLTGLLLKVLAAFVLANLVAGALWVSHLWLRIF